MDIGGRFARGFTSLCGAVGFSFPCRAIRFPETEKAMRELIATEIPQEYGSDSQGLPEGFSCEANRISIWWFYREGDRVATLHERYSDDHACFTVEGPR
jgi:hypothetical protein